MTVGARRSDVDPALVAPRLTSWEALSLAVQGCTVCAELAACRTHVVPGTFPEGAQVLLVGEAPGADEDAAGVPFIGRSGRLLDSLLAEAGLSRDRVAVANVLKCRPPGNRAPRRREVEACRPWLMRQVELADPRLVVTLGGSALAWALGPGARIGALRGRPLPWDGRWLMATYHPSAAIRFGPRGAPLAALREDLRAVARLLDGEGADGGTDGPAAGGSAVDGPPDP
ncbi:MAG TPA: uracil-DNA glycosylase [Jiangellales bacterium]|nr:uracil-DNA glycosylase [Jiangellales bacterium]